MTPIDEVLWHLKGVRQAERGYVALCPAHDDHHPSLAIASGRNGCVLLKCHAGCDTQNVLAALGLQFRDLFPDRR